jgi:hypothetical protein
MPGTDPYPWRVEWYVILVACQRLKLSLGLGRVKRRLTRWRRSIHDLLFATYPRRNWSLLNIYLAKKTTKMQRFRIAAHAQIKTDGTYAKLIDKI